MKIGIDFGTSYSAAAALVDGVPRSILFDGKPEFRTAVFFSHEVDDSVPMVLTAALERELAGLVKAATATQNRAVKSHQQQLAAAERVAGARQRAHALAQVVAPRRLSAEALREAALATLRRQWLERRRLEAREHAPRLGQAIFGEEAYAAYYAGQDGRLLHSPKSMLGYNLIGNAESLIGWVVRRIFAHIRATASAQLGVDVRAAVIGRPVEFKSSLGPAGTALALQRITAAAQAAGLEQIEFLEEPSAAAIDFHAGCAAPQQAVVVDIGGGTSDIAVARMGAGGAAPQILGTRGFARGGDDIDLDLSIAAFMPAFGMGTGVLPPTPYFNAAMLNDQDRQRDFRAASFADVPAPYGTRLTRLQEPSMVTRLAQQVEALKIRLSTVDRAEAALEFIAPDLAVEATRAQLDCSASLFLRTLEGETRACVEAHGADPEIVFLTGGMSQAPFVRACLSRMFPQAQVVYGNPKLGVVQGLARHAGQLPGYRSGCANAGMAVE